MAVAEQFLIRSGHSPASARNAVLSAEPFVRYREPLLRALEHPSVREEDRMTTPDPFATVFTQDRLLDMILLGFSGTDEPTPARS